jgi:putative membrane protein
MQWWCSATGMPWTWRWQWYPGVDLLVLLVLGTWLAVGAAQHWSRRPWGWFLPGWLGLWAALDWPIGKLAAGYLASAHTLEFLLLTLLAGPALLRAVPRDGWLQLGPAGTWRHRLLRTLAGPLAGLLIYNVLVIATHFPLVVDNAMTSQLGSLALDLSWLVAGLALWWPIVAPPEFHRLGMWGMIGYLFVATIAPTVPAMMMVFSDWPLYRLYEMAPRVTMGLTANFDIQLAGLVMKIIGDIPMWGVMIYIFWRGTAGQRELVDA